MLLCCYYAALSVCLVLPGKDTVLLNRSIRSSINTTYCILRLDHYVYIYILSIYIQIYILSIYIQIYILSIYIQIYILSIYIQIYILSIVSVVVCIYYSLVYYNISSIISYVTIYSLKTIVKDFPKERYNTYAKSCNSNLYKKYPGATYSGLLLGICVVYNVNSYLTIHF